MVVFDDAFVSTNVCSGIEIETQHRQNLHELILGGEGVELNEALRAQVAEIDQLNKELRQEARAVEMNAAKGNLSVDDFCALPEEPNLEALLAMKKRNVAAAKSASSIRQRVAFVVTRLPVFDKGVLSEILRRTLPDLEAEAANGVSAHFRKLGVGSETWVGEGMSKVEAATADKGSQDCPFCAHSGDMTIQQRDRRHCGRSSKFFACGISDAIRAGRCARKVHRYLPGSQRQRTSHTCNERFCRASLVG